MQLCIEYPAGTYDRFVTRIAPADEAPTWLFVESDRVGLAARRPYERWARSGPSAESRTGTR